jgi:cysteine desulfurase
MTSAIYLDHNATTPVLPEAAAAMADAMAQPGNASSVHRFGRLARRKLVTARAQVAALVGAEPRQVVFTSGGTEANNMALRQDQGQGTSLLVSAIEHDSILRPARERAAAEGVDLTLIPVDGRGVVDLDALAARLEAAPQPALVSVMLANNETGVIQPVAEAAEIAHAHGALLHCDAVQGPGKIAVDMAALGADLLTLSAHKFGGPQGVGALVLGPDLHARALLFGGGQERGFRAGTEPLPAIVGFGVAAERAAARRAAMQNAVAGLRDDLERRIRAIAPAARVHGAAAPRLPNTSCIGMPGVAAETQVIGFDLAGIAVSAGSACSSGKVTPSHVLAAMGLDAAAAGAAIRVSLGSETTAADIDRFVETWATLYAQAGGDRDAAPAA